MAATQSVSPGGALLRASRLFAVPAPLPRTNAKFEVGSVFGSNSGTTPYPLHQSITTPPSSLSRGDWGLKRPLPLRSTTKSSTPLIKVTTMDTFEHVTEFASAGAHTLTLKKWQALSLPISTMKRRSNLLRNDSSDPPKSVFEEDTDYTVQIKTKDGRQPMRWKFGGPWLAGQTEMEFNDFLLKEVRRRKVEFNNFLRKEYVRNHNETVMRKARDAGTLGEKSPETIAPADVTAEQFNKYVKQLRSTEVELYSLIRQFFDMPPPPSLPSSAVGAREFMDGVTTKKEAPEIKDIPPSNPYASTGPPKTHPSAGLSYLRTASYVINHPLFGPQADRTPIQGRVVMPRNASVGSFPPKLGVAGVLVEVPSSPYGKAFNPSSLRRHKQEPNMALPVQGLENIEPELVGGTKVWVQTEAASITPKGMIELRTEWPTERAVNMVEGKPFEAPKGTTFADRQKADSKNNAFGDETAMFYQAFGEEKEGSSTASGANALVGALTS